MDREDKLDVRRFLALAIGDGSDKDVLCFALHHAYGYTFRELGRIMGVTVERARQRTRKGGRKLLRIAKRKPEAQQTAKAAAAWAEAKALRLADLNRRNAKAIAVYCRDFNTWSELKQAHKFQTVEELRLNISESAAAVIDWAGWKEIHEIDAWVRRADIRAYVQMCKDLTE